MGWNQIYTKKFFCSSLAFLLLLPLCLPAYLENVETQYVLDTPCIVSLHSLIDGVYYLIDEDQPERAMPYFRRAIELDPNHVVALGRKGDEFAKVGNFKEALTYYEKVLDINPRLSDSSRTPYYDKVLEIDQTNVVALYNKGNSLSFFDN